MIIPVVRTAVALIGFSSIAYGAWLAWPPAGFLVGGIILVAAVVLDLRLR